MDAQVQTIVNDLPELGERLRRLEYDERSECAVLDHRESTHLLSVGKGSHRHRTTNYVYANGSSAIAVVDRDQEHYRLRYFEQYNYDTLMGLSTLPHAPQSSYACVKKTTPSVFEWAMKNAVGWLSPATIRTRPLTGKRAGRRLPFMA